MDEIIQIKVSQLPVATSLENLSILGIDLSTNESVQALMPLLKGLDGKSAQFQKTSTHIQWRVEGGAWANLIALTDIKGDKGDTGTKGDTGSKGDKGDTGVKGDTGAKGDKGDTGAPNSLSIGTVTGGATAAASITGTAPVQVLNLTLPKGDKGDTGDTGAQGAKGDTGTQGLQGLKGDKGDTGATPQFSAGTITAIEHNASPTFTLVADGIAGDGSPKYKINFSIPKGKDGEDGEGAGNTIISNFATGLASKKYVLKPSTNGSLTFTLVEETSTSLSGYATESYVDNKVKTDVPTGAKFTDTVTTINGKSGAIAKEDITALGIPSQDTAYAEITESEIDNQSATTLRTISGRRIGYLFGKIKAFLGINTTSGSTTKYLSEKGTFETISSGVSLGETSSTAYRGDRGKTAYDHSQSTHAPTNAQKNSDITKAEIEAKLTGSITSHTHDTYLPKSGGQLENYTEKLVTLSNGTINLNDGNVFYRNATANTTFSITNAKAGAHSFTLFIQMGATVRTLTFPASVKWDGGEIPDMTTASKMYILTFVTIDSGSNWYAMEGGKF